MYQSSYQPKRFQTTNRGSSNRSSISSVNREIEVPRYQSTRISHSSSNSDYGGGRDRHMFAHQDGSYEHVQPMSYPRRALPDGQFLESQARRPAGGGMAMLRFLAMQQTQRKVEDTYQSFMASAAFE